MPHNEVQLFRMLHYLKFFKTVSDTLEFEWLYCTSLSDLVETFALKIIIQNSDLSSSFENWFLSSVENTQLSTLLNCLLHVVFFICFTSKSLVIDVIIFILYSLPTCVNDSTLRRISQTWCLSFDIQLLICDNQ